MRLITIVGLVLLSSLSWADEVNVRWKNPSKDVFGDAVTDPVSITIHRLGAESVQLDRTFEPGSIGQTVLTVPCGVFQYTVTATINGQTSGASNPLELGKECEDSGEPFALRGRQGERYR